jgi:hypothetical protein
MTATTTPFPSPSTLAAPYGEARKTVCSQIQNPEIAGQKSMHPAGVVVPVQEPRTKAGSLRSVTIDGPAGKLEAVVNLGSPQARCAALVCHPHPLYGGNLHNKVVYHAMKALNEPVWGQGWPVLRFNFRGVGLSQGSHDGLAEAGDILAAIAWLKREFDLPLVVAGFSFGAAMAVKACSESPLGCHGVRALIALGLPATSEFPACHYPALHSLQIPKLFLSGDCDAFASAGQLTQITKKAADPSRLLLLPGADHFFTDQLEPMQHAIVDWLKELRL